MGAFWQHGYHGTSISRLCEATGLNRKTLYGEFGDKDALYAEAIGLYTKQALIQTEAVLQAEPLGSENIRTYFGGMHYEVECRGCLMTMTINEKALVPSPALDTVASTLSRIEELLRANLRAAGHGEATAERIATFLVFCIQGITTMGKLDGDNARLAHVVRTALSTLDET